MSLWCGESCVGVVLLCDAATMLGKYSVVSGATSVFISDVNIIGVYW